MVYDWLDKAQRTTGYLDHKEPKPKPYRAPKKKKSKKVKSKPVKEKRVGYYF